jgi:signal transduction histidine kinase/CheY-like chemotaxis protein/HPt (histidine-containing phosphotransfer) domain-containing protein
MSIREIETDSQLLHLVYQRVPLTTLLTAIVVPIFASQMWSVFPRNIMLVWLAAFVANCLFRSALSNCYRRAAPTIRWDEKTLKKWRTWIVIALAISGFSWGIGPALLMGKASGEHLTLLLFVVIISSAVAVNSLSEYLEGAVTYLAFALLVPASAAWLLASSTGSSAMLLLAFALLAGFASLTMVCRSANIAMSERLTGAIKVKKALADASRAQGVAEAASLAKTRFLATMSHELRTPLNAVIGGAQLLRVEQVGTVQQAQHINAIQQGGAHLLGLIENVLDLSRAESGEMPLHFDDFDIAQCIYSAANIVKLSAQSKSIAIHVDVDPDMPSWRHGDVKRVNQVVLNLLGNAVKFTAEGQISIRAIPFVTEHGMDGVRISIEDSGVGISAAELPHIFEIFRQADQGSNRRFGGSGLGLAIVKLWVQAMHGNVSATSRLGEGSTFTIDIPLPLGISTPPLENAVAKTDPVSLISIKHILVVEDDVMNQAVVCGLLRHAGHRTTVASNGTEALSAMARLTDIDLVLMDWHMPDMDGLEVTRRLRAGQAGEVGKSIPIVALTANAFAEDRAQCLAAGMNDFLTKPVQSANLIAAVHRWALDRRALEKPSQHVVFDAAVLLELSRVSAEGTADFGQEMLTLFLTTLRPALKAIKVAFSKGELKELQRAVHSLKSSSASVGGIELSQLAARHEADLRRGSPLDSNLVIQFETAIDRFELAVQSELVR